MSDAVHILLANMSKKSPVAHLNFIVMQQQIWGRFVGIYFVVHPLSEIDIEVGLYLPDLS